MVHVAAVATNDCRVLKPISIIYENPLIQKKSLLMYCLVASLESLRPRRTSLEAQRVTSTRHADAKTRELDLFSKS